LKLASTDTLNTHTFCMYIQALNLASTDEPDTGDDCGDAAC
jgi:hypothetical protein